MEIVEGPRIVAKPETHYTGIRVTTPFRGMRPGVLPAGRHASLTYVNHARQANKLLLEWAHDHGHALDRLNIRLADA